jgi:hypothetical protein
VSFIGTVSHAGEEESLKTKIARLTVKTQEDDVQGDDIEVIDIKDDMQKEFVVPLNDAIKADYQQLESNFLDSKLEIYGEYLEKYKKYGEDLAMLCLEFEGKHRNISKNAIEACMYRKKADNMIEEFSNEIEKLQAGSSTIGFAIADDQDDGAEDEILVYSGYRGPVESQKYESIRNEFLQNKYVLCKNYLKNFSRYEKEFEALCEENISENAIEACVYHKKATNMIEEINNEIEKIEATKDYQRWGRMIGSLLYTPYHPWSSWGS